MLKATIEFFVFRPMGDTGENKGFAPKSLLQLGLLKLLLIENMVSISQRALVNSMFLPFLTV